MNAPDGMVWLFMVNSGPVFLRTAEWGKALQMQRSSWGVWVSQTWRGWLKERGGLSLRRE